MGARGTLTRAAARVCAGARWRTATTETHTGCRPTHVLDPGSLSLRKLAVRLFVSATVDQTRTVLCILLL